MNCPDVGTLRALLDRPDATEERTTREHLAGCAACRDTLAELRRYAGLAAPAVGLLAASETPGAGDVEAALGRFTDRAEQAGQAHASTATAATAAAADASASPAPRSFRGRWSRLSGGLRAAAVAVVIALAFGVVVATPTGRSAAAGFLEQFRGEQLAVVTFDPNDPGLQQSMYALQSIGTLDDDAFASAEPKQVDTLAEASRQVGFPVRGVNRDDLPTGVNAKPTIYVHPAQEVSFTFDREKARRFVAQQGQPDVELPAKFDGASLTVRVPAAAVLAYPGPDKAPGLLAGQAGQIEAGTEGGVTLAEMREFLLGLPGLPEETVRQLREISDWRTTVPVLVPAGQVNWQRTTLGGTEALELSDQRGVASAVVWQRDGRIYGVGGPIGSAEARRAAAGLG